MAITITSFSTTIELDYFKDFDATYEAVQNDATKKNALFTNTTEIDYQSPNKHNINPQGSITRQAIIDTRLTALSLPTGQVSFTMQELVNLAGATVGDGSDITLYDEDSTNGLYIAFKSSTATGNIITNVGWTKKVIE